MMQLQSIAITDFRSIRGLIFLPLNAPMVLIHGQNGAGKTSILSALELALTGQVQSLGRIQSDYLASLPHQDVDRSVVKLVATGFGSQPTELGVTRLGITGSPLLDERQAHFFSERSFLAQATLSRLLARKIHEELAGADQAVEIV